MCGRFVSATDPDGLVRFFTVDDRQTDDLPASWNVAPTDQVYAVAEHESRRTLVRFRWGLVPFWADDPSIGSKMINARAESVADKPAFRESLARRRCLIPADGFYEWQRQGDVRTPYFVRRADGNPMAFAGLWATWRPKDEPDAERLRTCSIITTAANDRLGGIHPRMPVILEPDSWDRWLDREVSEAEALQGLLAPAADDAVEAIEVGRAVGNVRTNHPGLIDPA